MAWKKSPPELVSAFDRPPPPPPRVDAECPAATRLEEADAEAEPGAIDQADDRPGGRLTTEGPVDVDQTVPREAVCPPAREMRAKAGIAIRPPLVAAAVRGLCHRRETVNRPARSG